jgi:V/A-type H+-transporting ATPase subunit I
MKRVMVIGHLTLLREVVARLHAVGTLHITEIKEEIEGSVPEPLDAGERQRAEEKALEELLSRFDALTGLLPPTSGPVPEREELEHAPLAEFGRLLEEVETPLRARIKRRLEVEEELELVSAYERTVTVLAPLLASLETSHHFAAIGFTSKPSQRAQLGLLKDELSRVTSGHVVTVTRSVDEATLGTVVAFRQDDADKVRSVFSKGGVEELRLPSDLRALPVWEGVRVMQEKRRLLPLERERLLSEITEITRQHHGRLRKARQAIHDRLSRLHVVSRFGRTRRTFLILGYNPSASFPRLVRELRDSFGDKVAVTELPSDGHGHDTNVPVLLQNPGPVRPFEFFLRLIQRFPRYGSVDPTPLLALFFPLFFGMIVGDIGYGGIVLALAFFLRSRAKGREPLAPVSSILTVAGIWSLLFGVLYGELFGVLGEHYLGLHPFVNRAAADPGPFILGSILVGALHVSLGFIVGIINALRGRDWRHLVESVAMFLGSLSLLGCLGVVIKILPGSVLPWAGAMALVCMAVIAGLVGLVGPIEIVSAAGNVLSYARLAAFGLAGVYLVSASYTVFGEGRRFILGGVGNALVGVLVLVVFGLIQVLMVALECLLSPTIQPARLHFVEFFTKFKYYDHSGEPYRPFQQER